jgi:adenosine kinase
MTKTALICGSIAFDKIMQYHGRFAETLLADQLHRVNVSFLVPTMRLEYGGCAVNIAYNLKMLGGEPLVMGTIGQDGGPYLERMRQQGLDTRATWPRKACPSSSIRASSCRCSAGTN